MEEQNTQQEQSQSATQESVMQADPSDVEKNKMMAILAYFIFFIPLLTDAKNSKFAMFHANQSLVLLLFAVAGNIIAGMLTVVLIGVLLLPIVGIVTFVLWIMGIINAANGQMKELPVIGKIHILDK